MNQHLLTDWSPSTMSKISRGVSARWVDLSLSLKVEEIIADHGPPVSVDVKLKLDGYRSVFL